MRVIGVNGSTLSIDAASATHLSLIGQRFHNWPCVVQHGDTVKVESMVKVSI
jgi:hypothetical protein